MSRAGIEQKTSFAFIRYASVWEDADILCQALAPTCRNGRILSIASSGDNVLALLTLDPKEIVAADLNPAQLACLELRISAFRHLNHQALLEFLGVLPSDTRLKEYHHLRADMTQKAQEFWDKNPQTIMNGIIHEGRFEKYLKIFGNKILPWIHSKKIREELLLPRPLNEQALFYQAKWDTILWRLLFKFFFSRTLMGRLGRDPAFFDQVQGNVSERILARTRHALTKIPTNTNPYLNYIIKGNFNINALPLYLRPEFKDIITKRIDRITLTHSPIDQVQMGTFNGFNLSDIFEYMDKNEFETCYQNLLKIASPNARLVYWNMLVPRQAPENQKKSIKPLSELSRDLHFQDKAWFYQAFHIDEVKNL